MALKENQDKLREQIISCFCEIILPKQIQVRVFSKQGFKPNKRILSQALENTKKKIKQIINSIKVLNTEILRLKIPDADFLEIMFVSEYLFLNSVYGEGDVIKYFKEPDEPANDILSRFLCSYGITNKNKLRKYEEDIKRYLATNGLSKEDVDIAINDMYASLMV